MKVLIIEDEPKAAKELSNNLKEIRRDIIVLDVLQSVEDTIEWFNEHDEPDLIFSDIQLSDGLSFQVFKSVEIKTPVIFCTAFDEYMLEAFESNGINYLLKPISKTRLEQSLRRYDDLRSSIERRQTVSFHMIEDLLKPKSNYKNSLLVHYKEKIIPVRTDDIAFLFFNHGVIAVYLHNQQQYYVNGTLDDLEESLNPRSFFRANRQFIIHRDSIQDIERYFSRKLLVRLSIKTPTEVVVGKVKAAALLNWIERNH